MNPTWSSFLEPQGIIVAGGLVTALVALLKSVIPALDAKVSGATIAFAITGLLYVLTAAAVPPADANGYLVIFAAWLACATSSVGVHSTVTHVQGVAGK